MSNEEDLASEVDKIEEFIDGWWAYSTPGQGIGNPVSLPWEAFRSISRLITYYRTRSSRREKILRVALAYGQACAEVAHEEGYILATNADEPDEAILRRLDRALLRRTKARERLEKEIAGL